jgi:hypothetical protein
MCKVKAGTMQERIVRRAQWEFPEGMNVLAEYWPLGGEYSVITIVEGDSVARMMAAIIAWDDVFDFTITPAVTAKDGLCLAQQMMKS